MYILLRAYAPYLILFLALLIAAGIWYAHHRSPSLDLAAQVEAGTAYLLDVRTDNEWDAEHLAGAQHFALARLEQGELPAMSKTAPIYVYCRSGKRAATAKSILEQNGFNRVVNLGGLADAQSALAH